MSLCTSILASQTYFPRVSSEHAHAKVNASTISMRKSGCFAPQNKPAELTCRTPASVVVELLLHLREAKNQPDFAAIAISQAIPNSTWQELLSKSN